MDNALSSLTAGGFSIGLEAPLDNDWTAAGEQARRQAGRLPGEPDLQRHADLAVLADRLGFRALWVRDVPLYDPAFGDAGQVFEIFTYLGYLAGVTRDILLGTAAVVLPLREPLLTLKSAASVQRLSGNRLLLGVASGDRPVEYPLFGRDFPNRGAAFREQVALLRQGARGSLPDGLDVLPRAPAPPLLVAGLAQQTPAWIGAHMDACLAYPGAPDDHARRSAAWRQVAGDKPYASFIHLDLPRTRTRRCGAFASARRRAATRWRGNSMRCAPRVCSTSACTCGATSGRWPTRCTRSPSTCCRSSMAACRPRKRKPRPPEPLAAYQHKEQAP